MINAWWAKKYLSKCYGDYPEKSCLHLSGARQAVSMSSTNMEFTTTILLLGTLSNWEGNLNLLGLR